MTTDYAIERLMKEILPRIEDESNVTYVKYTGVHRKGDNAAMGYIEVVGK